MSVDERLRSALKDQAGTFLPAVETALDRVHAEGRAARWRTAAVGIIGAAATVAVVGGAVAWLGLPDPASTPPTSNPSSSVSDATPGPSSSPSPLRLLQTRKKRCPAIRSSTAGMPIPRV